MLEILAPAGSPEAVMAAVTNGADAVYLGLSDFNARRNAKNFSDEEFYKAAEYCRVRGVKVYVTLNTLVGDREIDRAVELARRAWRLGADALIVQDLGVLRAVRSAVPDMPLHASTQMSIHNSEGVKMAAAMGLSRVVLARELSEAELAHICENSPIEIEVFVHGALCMCYSGQCYMSAVIGRRSGNRGLCAQPCRLAYESGGRGKDHPLSLKDNCLINYLDRLDACGVKSIKIEGRMKRPEYTAAVTGVYARAVKDKKPPSEEDEQLLRDVFSRQGFTDGYYTGRLGEKMLGVREDADKRELPAFSTIRKQYLHGEYQRVPVRFAGMVKYGEVSRLAAMDDLGNTVAVEGPEPEIAFHKELTPVSFQTQLCKTGGTPYYCAEVKSEIGSGISLSAAQINELRRSALEQLTAKRKALPERLEYELEDAQKLQNIKEIPFLNISVSKLSQLSPAMSAMAPKVLYVPVTELKNADVPLRPFLENGETSVAAVLPRVIHDNEADDVRAMLEDAKRLGIEEVLAGNLGQIVTAKSMGFRVRGDFGLNAYNARTVRVLKELGLISATLSFELRLEQIRDMSKAIDTEMIVYGRLPLMITENCIIKNSTGVCSCDNFPGIKDRSGFTFPVVKEYGCRNVVLNSKKLFLADRQADYMNAGLWGVRLSFTTENALECTSIMGRYLGMNDYQPAEFTRGLYYRGVE
ncbi:MAG: U32 family peptidase [Oscillospiraceae bacterium]|nr:U32 family peptidase [Oscillospiraceae bacterium]